MPSNLQSAINNPQDLPAYLDSLSNARRRLEGNRLGDQLMISVPEEKFWQVFRVLVSHDRKAYLVTLLKTLAFRLNKGTLTLEHGELLCMQHVFTDVDKAKILQFLLPEMKDPDEAQKLFSMLGYTSADAWLPHLINQKSMVCAFLLMKSVRYHEHDYSILVRTALFLMKRGDSLGFNMASIIKTAYQLDEIRGTFSLRLSPFQLARLETSYLAFCDTMKI